jgi:hypothetical protein
VLRNILAKGGPWSFAVRGKTWLPVAVDTLAWALAATVLYVAIFYVAMWLL